MLYLSATIVLFLHLYCCEAQVFHQDDYDIVNHKIEINDYNKTILQNAYGRVFKYNDTVVMKAISFGGTFLQEVKTYFYMHFIMSKDVSGTYRELPFNFTAELCYEYAHLGHSNPFGLKTAIEISNFRGCPMLKQEYHLNDWLVEQDKFPPHLPAGNYSLSIKGWVDDSEFLFDAIWFGQIVPKGGKKKRKGRKG